MTDNANLERVARAIHFTNIPDGEMASAEHWWRECRPHRLAQARAAIASLEAETAMRSAATIQSAPSKGEPMSKGFEFKIPPSVPTQRPFSLIERLRETKDGFPQYGNGGIGSDGSAYIKMLPTPQVSINPDGPEAAKLIEELIETLKLVKEAIADQDECEATAIIRTALLSYQGGDGDC